MKQGAGKQQPLRFIWILFLPIILLVACSLDSNPGSTPGNLGTPPVVKTATAVPTSSPTPSATPEPVSLLGVDPAELNGTRISFWHTLTGESGRTIQELVDEFNRQNEWGIQIETQSHASLDDLSANLRSTFDSGDPPDLSMGYLYQALDWDADWGVVDLSNYVDDPVWGMSQAEQDDFHPVFWNHDVISPGLSDDGEQRLGIPFIRSGTMLYYNQGWAEELGFNAPPASPEEFRQQACAAAQANLADDVPENDGTGGWIISTSYSGMLGWLDAFGADVSTPLAEADQDAYQFDSPEVEEALNFLRDLYDRGCSWLSDEPYPDNGFANRLGLFATSTISGIPSQQVAFDRVGNNDQWTVIPFPSTDDEGVIQVYGPSLVLLSSSPAEQLAAWLLTRWLVEPQNLGRIVQQTTTYPPRIALQELLQSHSQAYPQYGESLNLLPLARAEPQHQSWSLVRWAVSDAATQLYRFYFTIDQVPGLVELLNQTAADLHTDPAAIKPLPTPTATITPTASPTPVITVSPSPTPMVRVSPTP